MREYQGRLDLVIGTMFSGKTLYLLSQMSMKAHASFRILYINSEVDTRGDDPGKVYSTHHPCLREQCEIPNVVMIKADRLAKVDVSLFDMVVVDESQFFPDLVSLVHEWLNMGRYVLVAGLVADAEGKPFGETLQLIPQATQVIKLHAYCKVCAEQRVCQMAVFSKRLAVSEGSAVCPTVDIGGDDKYIAVCRQHYYM